MRLFLNVLRFSFLAWLAIGLILPCFALDLSPRQWNHLPVGSNFAGIAYANTNADIFFDPVLLINDAQMNLETVAGKYIHTFRVFDKSLRLDLTQGYQKGTWEGLLNSVPTSVKRDGFTDSFVRLAVNLYGAPSLRGKAYAEYRADLDVETIVGMGLALRLPTGEYFEDKLINLGDNRFTFRPQFGLVHRRGKWTGEVTAEVSFFTDNDEFFNGKKLEQKPLLFAHGHLMYTFRPGLWLGVSAGFDYGGENKVDGIKRDNRRLNFGWGLSFAYPFNRYSGINFTYIGARTQEATGLDFDTLALSLAISW